MIYANFLLLSAVLLLGAPGIAAGQAAGSCPVADLPKETAAALPRLAQIAHEIAKTECDRQKPSARILSLRILELLQESEREFKALGITEDIWPFARQVAAAAKAVDAGRPAAGMTVVETPPGIVLYGESRVSPGKEKDCDAAVARAQAAQRVGVRTCLDLFYGFKDIYVHAQISVQRRYTELVAPFLELSEKQWDDFLTKSRSQTILELWINTLAWQGRQEKGKFLAPPEMQWIVLHPSVVLERVPAEVEGNQMKEGLLFEIVGANWWRRDEWYQLSGASLVAVYSDRAGVPDWGGGFALHFGNKFTAGAVKRSGSTGIFISLDVLELVKDKKAMLERYVGAVAGAR